MDTTVGGGNTKKIALGLGGGFHGHKIPELLEKFSSYVDAPYYQQWEGYNERIVLVPKRLGDWIRKNMDEADEIHFNLDSWKNNNYKRYLRKRYRAFNGNPPDELTIFDDTSGYITNWEYHQIVTNPDLLNKTIFYDRGGNVRPQDKLFLPT